MKLHPTAFLAASALACATWLALRPAESVRMADKYLRAQVISSEFSGAVLVAQHGRVVLARGYGYADVANRILNDAHTRFRIGSVTKSFTAVLVLRLRALGLLAVEEPICKYIEPCPEAWAGITLHHLLSHTSGIANFTLGEDFLEKTARPASREQVLAEFRDQPLHFAPGEKFEYSNSNYYLIGLIVEKVTGKTYAEALAEHVLAPAGLTSTAMDSAASPAERVAAGYRPADDGTLKPDSPLDPSWSFAAGGLISTVEDLHRFELALEDDRLLTKPSRDLLWTPVKDRYGYGWNMGGPAPETLNRRVRMHSGRTQGYTACFVEFPDDDLTSIVLSNNVMADTCSIVRDLAAIVLGEPYTIPIPRRAMKVDAAILDRYVGTYRLSEGPTVAVRREGDLLIAQAEGSPDHLQLYAETPTSFFLKTMDVTFAFSANRAGEIVSLRAQAGGREFVASRISD